eukprot:m.9694 g.9694  ORF g.9694 m.9694 type:complete len:56 (+) comp21556_c0_seq1:487-654(+)
MVSNCGPDAHFRCQLLFTSLISSCSRKKKYRFSEANRGEGQGEAGRQSPPPEGTL